MYKLMIFIKKSADEDWVNHFRKNTLKNLEEVSGREIKIAEIEGAAMMEEPYNKVCELSVDSKKTLDEMLASPKGKNINREISSLMNQLSLFFINYEE